MKRLLLLLCVLCAPLHAEEVTLKHGGLTLLADFVEADDALPSVALITHGTLAHKDMELVETLQEALAERGVASLAHTLSLGVDARRGMADCAAPQIHRDEDADREIALWIDWLKKHAHERPTLIGHSRGAKEVARTAAKREDLHGVVLMAPATAGSERRAREGYEARYGTSLDAVLAEAHKLSPDVVMDVPGILYCADTTASAGSVLSYYDGEPTGAETYAPDIDAPVLVVLARADAVVPDAPAAFMPLRNDALNIALVDDADHMFLDFYAEDAADLIAEFMAHEPKAASPTIDFENADLEYGAYLGQECASCHSANGSNPPLDGLEAGYLHHALGQYANGERDNAAMALVARSLDDEQRIAIAAHFAAQLK